MSKLWDKVDQEDLELDRQYYLSKIDELCRCLPVVRAAKTWAEVYDADCLHPERGDAAEVALWRAVETLEAEEKEATNG